MRGADDYELACVRLSFMAGDDGVCTWGKGMGGGLCRVADVGVCYFDVAVDGGWLLAVAFEENVHGVCWGLRGGKNVHGVCWGGEG